jgi:hypothetical protein
MRSVVDFTLVANNFFFLIFIYSRNGGKMIIINVTVWYALKKTNDDVLNVYRLDGQSEKWIENRKKNTQSISLNKTPMVYQRYLHSVVPSQGHAPYCRITFSMILLVLVAIKVKHVSLCIIFKWSTILLVVASRNVKTGRRSPRPSPGQWKKSTSLRCDCPMCTNDFNSLVKGANKK